MSYEPEAWTAAGKRGQPAISFALHYPSLQALRTTLYSWPPHQLVLSLEGEGYNMVRPKLYGKRHCIATPCPLSPGKGRMRGLYARVTPKSWKF